MKRKLTGHWPNPKRADFRIESCRPMHGPLLPRPGVIQIDVSDRSLAVVMAAKSFTLPMGSEIRVVHVPTGEIVFKKQTTPAAALGDC